MLSIIADAMMVATKTNSCGGWSECRPINPPTPRRDSESVHRRDPVEHKWFDRAGER